MNDMTMQAEGQAWQRAARTCRLMLPALLLAAAATAVMTLSADGSGSPGKLLHTPSTCMVHQHSQHIF
jgi:hypothetical protein